MSSGLRDTTITIRAAALELHRLLVHAQKAEHERLHGPVETPSLMLDLVARGEAFDWLHPLSELIVAIDQLLEMPEMSLVDAAAVRLEMEMLLSSDARDFQSHYRAALQADPHVVMAHADLRRLLADLPTPRPEDAELVASARARWTAPRVRGPSGMRH